MEHHKSQKEKSRALQPPCSFGIVAGNAIYLLSAP
jgi:hypothetical protein